MTQSILICNWAAGGMASAAWGRPATYDLFDSLHRDGYPVHYVESISHLPGQPPTRFPNPKGLPGHHSCLIGTAPLSGPHPEIVRLVDQVEPDLLIGVDFGGLLCLNGTGGPGRPLIYLSTGSNQVRALLETGRMQDLQHILDYFDAHPPVVLHSAEEEAVALADLIIANSEVGAEVLRTFFPAHRHKILPDAIWFAEWIIAEPSRHQDSARPFSDREVDVLFVATNWARVEKNFALVRQILEQTRGLRVSIVGAVPSEPPDATCEGFIGERGRLFELMGNSRVVVCPSRFDTAPGILFEGSVMGCNLVASRNCGNSGLCHPDLLAERLTAEEFADKIARGIKRKYPDRLSQYLEPSSYQALKDTFECLGISR